MISREEEELVRKQRMEAGKEDDEENKDRGKKGDASKEKSYAAVDGQGYRVWLFILTFQKMLPLHFYAEYNMMLLYKQ